MLRGGFSTDLNKVLHWTGGEAPLWGENSSHQDQFWQNAAERVTFSDTFCMKIVYYTAG